MKIMTAQSNEVTEQCLVAGPGLESNVRKDFHVIEELTKAVSRCYCLKYLLNPIKDLFPSLYYYGDIMKTIDMAQCKEVGSLCICP
jgi:hypothetical protein